MFRRLKRKWRKKEFVMRGRARLKNFDETFFIMLTALICGLLVGGVYAYSKKTDPARHAHAPASLTHTMAAVKRLFSPIVSVPGLQSNGDFVFADFESSSNFSIWHADSANLQPSAENALNSDHSGQLQFHSDVRLSGIRIAEYFKSRYAEHDWSQYKALSLYAHNPENEIINFVIQVKDGGGKRYSHKAELAPSQSLVIEMPINEIDREIEIRDIEQISIFIWNNTHECELYIDDLKLTGSGPKAVKL